MPINPLITNKNMLCYIRQLLYNLDLNYYFVTLVISTDQDHITRHLFALLHFHLEILFFIILLMFLFVMVFASVKLAGAL